MSRDFPALVDPLQLARARRAYSGSWPLARLDRFARLVEDAVGDVVFDLEFGVDDLGIAFVDVRMSCRPTLLCQQTLEPFPFPIDRTVRIGFIQSETEESALPEGYEPFLVTDEPVKTTDLIEDELILSLPLVAKSSDEPVWAVYGDSASPEPAETSNAFAALAALKQEN